MIFNQTIYLLKLRFRIAVRIMRDLGWLRACLLGVIVTALVGRLAVIPDISAGWAIAFLGIMAVGVIHQSRSDLCFLSTLTPHYKISIAAEYLAVNLPLITILLYRGAFSAVLLLMTAVAVIPFIPVWDRGKSSAKHYRTSLFYHLRSYEWIAGFRRFKIILGVIVILGIVLSTINYVAAFVVLYLMTALISGFYAECEPRRFLLISAPSPILLLLGKISRGAGLYTVLTLPIWGLLLIKYPSSILYTSFFMLMNIILISSMILAKYMLYEEQRNLDYPLMALFGILSLCSFVPYLQIVLIPLLIFFWIKATSRLKQRVYA